MKRLLWTLAGYLPWVILIETLPHKWSWVFAPLCVAAANLIGYIEGYERNQCRHEHLTHQSPASTGSYAVVVDPPEQETRWL